MNLFNSFIAAASFYIIPILLGTGITAFVKVALNNKFKIDSPLGPLFDAFRNFVIGALLIFGIKTSFPHLPTQSFVMIVLILLSVFSVFTIINLVKNLHTAWDMIIKWFGILLFCIVLSAGAYYIWKLGSPFTATLNWDIYHHQTLASLITKGQFNFTTSKMSDTFQFDGYSTMFHVLLSLPQSIFKPNILGFWWFIEYFHLLSTVLASFLVAYALSRRIKVGLISAIIGTFIFESSGAYTALFLMPQNLAATVGVVLIAKIINDHEKNKWILDPIDVIFAIYIFLNHLIIGAFLVGLVLITAIFLLIKSKINSAKLENIITMLSLLALILVPVIASLFNLNFINHGEAAYFNPSYADKWELMKAFYGYGLLVYFPLGIFFAVKHRTTYSRLLLILAVVSIAVVIAPIPYSFKFYSVGRYFVHTLLALGIWMLIKNWNNFLYWITIGFLGVTLAAVFTVNVVRYKQVPSYQEIYTHISPSELEAAKFLKDKYGNKNAFFISEPATMHIMEGVSEINTPGGAYANPNTREVLSKIYYSRDPSTLANQITSIKDTVIKQKPDIYLLGVSGRFDRWEKASDEMKYGIYWNVWTPYDLSPEALDEYDFIDFLRKQDSFVEVFRNNGIVIFEVKPKTL